MDVDAEPFAEGLEIEHPRDVVFHPLLKIFLEVELRQQERRPWTPVMVMAVRLTTRMEGFYRGSQSYTAEDAEDAEGSSP